MVLQEQREMRQKRMSNVHPRGEAGLMNDWQKRLQQAQQQHEQRRREMGMFRVVQCRRWGFVEGAAAQQCQREVHLTPCDASARLLVSRFLRAPVASSSLSLSRALSCLAIPPPVCSCRHIIT